MPPHFHAGYGSSEVIVSINDIEVIEGELPNKQQKMLLGWAALHQEELMENWHEISKNYFQSSHYIDCIFGRRRSVYEVY